MHIITVPVGQLRENCYVVCRMDRKDAVLIDPGEEADKIREALGGREPAAVLLTHGHFDHTGALADFAGLPIYMHEADRHMLSQRRFVGAGLAMDTAPRPAPTDFLTDGQSVEIAGITFEVLHTPGTRRAASAIAAAPASLPAIPSLMAITAAPICLAAPWSRCAARCTAC